MRTISGPDQTLLNGSVLTWTTCLKITRLDNTVLGLTVFDRPLVFAGVTYQPLDGIDATALRLSISQGIDNLEVNGVLNSNYITDADLLAGRYDNAAVELFQVNWAANPITTRVILTFGYLGNLTYSDGGYHAEIRALSSRLTQPIGEQTSPLCRVFQLGDSRCRVKLDSKNVSAITQTNPPLLTTSVAHGRVVGDSVFVQGCGGMTQINGLTLVVMTVPLTTTMTLGTSVSAPLDATGFSTFTSGGTIGYRFSRTVASVQSAQQITFGSDPNLSSFYQYGVVTFSTGANQGISREVKDHTLSGGNAVVTLAEAFPFAVGAGDAATLEAGCDRTIGICSNRYKNQLNYRGEPTVPGTDIFTRRGRR